MATIAAAQPRSPGIVRPQYFQPDAGGAIPSSPRTPNRTFSSALSSPSIAAKSEEDPLIIEFGARYLRAGFARDRLPMCSLGVGPAEQRRAGDYRYWEPGYTAPKPKRGSKHWTDQYELWPLDLRTANLGLVEDKVERLVRSALTRHLLVDSKSRRVSLILPPAVPHPLLSIILTTLFNTLQCPTVTLFSSPVLTAVAAGLRSALVVDLGWHETVVTAVFEYREVHCRRSVRAGKRLLFEFARLLDREIKKSHLRRHSRDSSSVESRLALRPSVEEIEDVLVRYAWCRDLPRAGASSNTDVEGTDPVKSVFLRSTVPSMELHVPFSSFSDPTELALFSDACSAGGFLDDEELPIGLLAYNTLLDAPVDIRSTCMSRIIVVGGGSQIAGVKRRIVGEVSRIYAAREWNRVLNLGTKEVDRPSTPNEAREVSAPIAERRYEFTAQHGRASDLDQPVDPPSRRIEPEVDHISEHLRRIEAKETTTSPIVQGVIRAVESLGPWSGASLVSGLRIKGVVEVEKEKFLQHGLAGAHRDIKPSGAQRQSGSGPNTTKSGAGDRSSWALGVWT